MRANPAASSPLLAQALLSLGLVAIASPAVVLVAMPRHLAFVVVVVALPGPAGTELYILAKLVLIIAIPSVGHRSPGDRLMRASMVASGQSRDSANAT
ncbi:hypothetical protein [Agrococcus sp. Marseille-Q4369]|uniref:hypothetical protein n=1 Tax=Agrococcus sp. Marseille-Q4369 TaxID=2810513 RepID=UPI001B8D68DA|nr:hypothetical protein [Agrococcus sp. Marseille-Q4369]QUW18100.1 hypothetical protein JSQ78_09625 [Agrococcus sp. Marseille-Q4369]